MTSPHGGQPEPGKPPRRTLKLGALDYSAAVGILAYACSATITPICLVILARELGFTLVGGGLIETTRSGLLLLSLLASGFVAARWGKPLSLGVSCLVLGSGMLLYSIAPIYGVIVLGVALLGLGGGILEGLIAPLVQDLHPGESGRYLNIINAFWSVGVLLTMLVAGELLTQGLSWRLIAGGLGVLSGVSGLLFLLFQQRAPIAPRYNLTEVFRHKRALMGMPRFWFFMGMMFTAGAAEGGFMFWSASYIQLQYETLPRAGGLGAGLFAAGMVVGRFGSGLWIRQHELRRWLLFTALAGTVISSGFPFIESLYLTFAGLFLVGLSIASFWPSLQAYAADRLPVETTSLFVLLSVGGIPGFAFAAWVIGFLGDQFGLRGAFFLNPVFLALLTILLLLEPRIRGADFRI